MNKLAIQLAFLFIFSISIIGAQPKREEIKAMRIAFISEHIGLTVEEAKSFWPVFDEFQAKRKLLHKQSRQVFKTLETNSSTLTDAESEKLCNQYITSRTNEAALAADYHQKYLKILPAKKILLLYESESLFKKEMLKKFKDTHGSPHQNKGGHFPPPDDDMD